MYISLALEYRYPSEFQFMNEIDIFMIQFFKEQEKNSRLINQGQSMRQIRPKCAHFEYSCAKFCKKTHWPFVHVPKGI